MSSDKSSTSTSPPTQREFTFVLLKPDCLKKKLIGEVITRFEKKGYEIFCIKIIHPRKEIVEQHYKEHVSFPYFQKNVDFICSGPVCAMVVTGPDVVNGCRKLQGATKPSERLPGTIRGDFSHDITENILHVSDSKESAKRELELWFRDE